MKIRTKILTAAVSLFLCATVIPWLSICFFQSELGFGFFLICFFALYPLLHLCLGILAGTDLRRLWWIPVAAAALFPPLFWIAVGDLAWDLYFYSIIYLPIGALPMLGVHLGKAIRSKKAK